MSSTDSGTAGNTAGDMQAEGGRPTSVHEGNGAKVMLSTVLCVIQSTARSTELGASCFRASEVFLTFTWVQGCRQVVLIPWLMWIIWPEGHRMQGLSHAAQCLSVRESQLPLLKALARPGSTLHHHAVHSPLLANWDRWPRAFLDIYLGQEIIFVRIFFF